MSTHSSPRPKTAANRRAFWQRHVSRWRASELSKATYCQQHTLTYHQMVYWCRKVELADVPEAPSRGFIAVNVSTSATSISNHAGHSALSLRLPNGVTIEGINDDSVALVGKLIAQL